MTPTLGNMTREGLHHQVLELIGRHLKQSDDPAVKTALTELRREVINLLFEAPEAIVTPQLVRQLRAQLATAASDV